MKRLIAAAVLTALALPANAQVAVQGYYRQNGTYVQPHMRSAPDGNPYNNYSTQGNVNPYTGQTGTHVPQPTYPQPVYVAPPTVQVPTYPTYPAYPTYPQYGGTR